MFPQEVSDMIKNQMKLKVLRKYFDNIKGEMERITSPTVLKALVISTKISSFWGSADEGSVGAEPNAWDSSFAPRADWDVMVDNCEETGLEVEYQFEKKTDCLPKQLMVSFCGVFS